MTIKFISIFVFLSHVLTASAYQFINFQSHPKYQNCVEVPEKSVTVPISHKILNYRQGNYGACFLVAGLSTIHHMMTRSGLEDTELSLSDAYAWGMLASRGYKEGGTTEEFLMNLSNRGRLIPRNLEKISHDEVVEIVQNKELRTKFGGKKVLNKYAQQYVKYLHGNIKGIDLPSYKIKVTNLKMNEKGQKDLYQRYLDEIFKILKFKGQLINLPLKNHVTNIVGLKTYQCEVPLSPESQETQVEEVTTLILRDPNGHDSILSGNFLADSVINLDDGIGWISSLLPQGQKGQIDQKELIEGDLRIYFAVLNRNPALVKELLQEKGKIDLEEQHGFGWTVLAEAVVTRQLEIVKLLVKHGANPNDVGDKKSLLGFASEGGSMKVLKYLRDELGLSTDTMTVTEKVEALTNSLIKKNSTFARFVLSHLDVDINAEAFYKNEDGKKGQVFPLCQAIYSGMYDIAELLMDDPMIHLKQHAKTHPNCRIEFLEARLKEKQAHLLPKFIGLWQKSQNPHSKVKS